MISWLRNLFLKPATQQELEQLHYLQRRKGDL